MNIRAKGYLLGLLILGITHVSFTQEKALKQCLQVAGASDQEAFLTFDRELRVALSNQDPTLMAILAAYPLRVNVGGGSTSVDDATTLYVRSREVFTAAVRSKVLGTKIPDIICTNSGLGYGNGALWVYVRDQSGLTRFVIGSVNLPDTSNRASSSPVFVCRAENQRAVIDRRQDGRIRFRSWNRPRNPTETPDTELLSGKESFEGTGGCAHKVWTFKIGSGSYVASQLGCFPDSNPPPEGSLGVLSLNVSGQETKRWWCY
jgi:hypothetical protein